MVLCFDACMVDECAGIRYDATHGAADVLVELSELLNRGRQQELGANTFLDGQDHTFASLYSDGGGSVFDGLVGVLDLE